MWYFQQQASSFGTTAAAYEKELQVAKSAVRLGAQLAHKVTQSKVNCLSKEDRSPVTVADFGAQGVIIGALKQAFPVDPIVGEEDSQKLRANAQLADQVWELAKEVAPRDPAIQSQQRLLDTIDCGQYEGGPQGRMWTLDPIDGTMGFLRGGQYAVCLALIVDAVVRVAVIGCPNLGPKGGLYFAVKDRGAYVEPLFEDGPPQAQAQRIHFRELVDNADAVFCESVEPSHSAIDVQAEIARSLKITKSPIRMDSQAKYCTLAEGKADIYLRLPVTMDYQEKIWDHAPGNLLISEAGGVVTDMYGQPLDFGVGRTLKNNKGIIASTPAVHAQLIKAIMLTRW